MDSAIFFVVVILFILFIATVFWFLCPILCTNPSTLPVYYGSGSPAATLEKEVAKVQMHDNGVGKESNCETGNKSNSNEMSVCKCKCKRLDDVDSHKIFIESVDVLDSQKEILDKIMDAVDSRKNAMDKHQDGTNSRKEALTVPEKKLKKHKHVKITTTQVHTERIPPNMKLDMEDELVPVIRYQNKRFIKEDPEDYYTPEGSDG